MNNRQTIPLADLDRLAKIAPDMPAHQVAQAMRWIAELQPLAQTASPIITIAPIPNPAPEPAPDDAALAAFDAAIAADGPMLPPVAPQPVDPPVSAPPVRVDQRPKAWTHDEVRTALDMRNKGQAVPAIASRLGRPVPGTAFMLHKLRGGLRPAGYADKPAETTQPAQSPTATVPTVKPSPMPSHSLTDAQRKIMARVMRMDDDFTPQDHLYLVEGIIGKMPLNVIADQLGCDIPAARSRWIALVGYDPTKDPSGWPVQEQRDLVAVLLVLASEAAA